MAEPVFVPDGGSVFERWKEGKLFRMMAKSSRMEAIIAELDPGVETEFYSHEGEEIHVVLEGKMVYEVGDKRFEMKAGDVLWHPSNQPHRALNPGGSRVVYLTVGTPPTFM